MAPTDHKGTPYPTDTAVRGHRRMTSAAGISLTELLMSITLFSITVTGAIGAINAIDRVTTSYISEGEQREANHADFNNAYERISQQPDTLSSLTSQSGFGLEFVDIPRTATNCPITAVGSPTNADITFAMAAGCPTKQTLRNINDNITLRDQDFFLSIKGAAKLCSASFPTPGNLTGSGPVTVRSADPDCLRKPDNSSAQVGDIIYFPEFQVTHKLEAGQMVRNRAALSSAVFFPYARLEEQTTENCIITNNVDKPVSGFDIDGVPGTGSGDQTDAVTITISRGFIAAEDRLYIDNATFTTTTNSNTGDTIHTYTGINSGNTAKFPTGLTVDATYNESQGFMRITSASNHSVSHWEDVFKRIRYSNALTADGNDATTYTPVDRQIIFALGRYPTRLVDDDFHFYNFVGCGGTGCISWIDAFNAAKNSSNDHLGMTGYLTTITSDEENIFVSDRARVNVGGIDTFAAGWLGGRDALDDTSVAGTSNMCSSLPAGERAEGKWYWVTGKEGDELCTKFWEGKQGSGKPINFDGSVSTNSNTRSVSDWNCSNGTAISTVPHNGADKYLTESWWFSDRRGRDEFRFANWSGGSKNGPSCASPGTVGEPNNCCSGEDFLQMTGLPSGARLWNDLFLSGSSLLWYAIRGYFSEWDTSKLGSDVILARDTRLNVVRHNEVCEDN